MYENGTYNFIVYYIPKTWVLFNIDKSSHINNHINTSKKGSSFFMSCHELYFPLSHLLYSRSWFPATVTEGAIL